MFIAKYSLLILLIIILVVLLILCIVKPEKNKVEKKQQEELHRLVKETTERLRKEQETLQKQKADCEINIQKQLAEQERLHKQYEEEKEKLKNNYSQYIIDLQNKTKEKLENIQQAKEQYFSTLEKEYEIAEEEYDKKISLLKNQEIEINEKILTLKNQFSAGVEAQLREREKEEKINFYKLCVSKDDLKEIEILDNTKKLLKQPVILNKLIWSTYFQKQANELCNRVVGTQTICGIYKITNLNTKQIYIGQSIDISARFKQHIKGGLGINASTTNKLYTAMQQYGVWNFSFEVVESCSKEKLNEKEKFWINMFQSDKFGYNLTKGGS